MSASEKLEALDKRMKNVRTRRIVTTPAGHELFITVSDALPEIIAVVKAAEIHAKANPPKHDPPCTLGSCSFHSALSALDEALPDLGVATDSESPPLR